MVIGTSAIVDTELDGAVGMNSGIFNNPFLDLGQVPQGPFQNDAEALVPVPSHADGRRTRRTVFAALAGNDRQPESGKEQGKVHLVYCGDTGKKGRKELDRILTGTKTMVVRGTNENRNDPEESMQ